MYILKDPSPIITKMKINNPFFTLPILASLLGIKGNTSPNTPAPQTKSKSDGMVIGYPALNKGGEKLNIDLIPILSRKGLQPKVLNKSTEGNLISSLEQAELRKIELTNEGKTYSQRIRNIFNKTQTRQPGGLRDTATFMSSDLKVYLNKFIGKTYSVKSSNSPTESKEYAVKSGKIKFIKLSPKESGYEYAFIAEYNDGTKEKWYLNQEARYLDQFPKGSELNNVGLGIWKAEDMGSENRLSKVDKLTQNFFTYGEAFHDGTIDASYLFRRFNEAKKNREVEQKDPANVAAFDLPKDKPIGYIGLISANWKEDPVSAGMADDVRFMPEVMSSLGYQMVTLGENMECIAASREPTRFIEKMIEAYKERGVNHIFIHPGTHGARDSFIFQDNESRPGDPTKRLRGLSDTYKKHPDIKCFLYSPSCCGGGTGKDIKDYHEPENAENGQVTSFLQSKGYGIVEEGRIEGTVNNNGSPKVYSTYFNIFFIEYLRQGMPFGEAFKKADIDSKKLFPSDPEVWKSSKAGGIQTTDFNQDLIRQASSTT